MVKSLSQNLTNVETHFAFGENWSGFSEKIGADEIEEAKSALDRLIGAESIAGRRFLDIGCGSGLHSLAALLLGASDVVAVDLDPRSVETTERVLGRFAPVGAKFRVMRRSVLDLTPTELGTFDVTYSWGVLHHTGEMFGALDHAASLTAPGGLFAFALYRKTWLCRFWTAEKRWYTSASLRQQKWAQRAYAFLFRIALRLTGRNFGAYLANYKSKRGMDFYHDIHDWLGGFPYESISEREVFVFMTERGFEPVRRFVANERKVLGRQIGIFGSGCDEYVYSNKRDDG